MIKNWLPFHIYLPAFYSFLKQNVSKADGILAGEESFEIVELETFEQSDIDTIDGYLNSLTEEGETSKASAEETLASKILGIKTAAILKSYYQLTLIERKILFNVPLTEEELAGL